MSTQPTFLPAVRSIAISGRSTPVSWRQRGIGILRIAFGIVWAIDAWFKWQSGFVHNITDYLASAQAGQPAAVQAWIAFWLHIVQINPTFFAHLIAIEETTVALTLMLGIFTNLTSVIGILISFIIWSTAEGFGGPYMAGSTDIGTAIIYVLVFAGLLLTSAGLYYGLDRHLTRALGRWSFLASGPIRSTDASRSEGFFASQSDDRA